MVSKKVTIVNAEGMHMRPAGMIAKAVKAHSDSEVILKANDKDIKAKNVMQIMAAGLKNTIDEVKGYGSVPYKDTTEAYEYYRKLSE